MSALDGFHIEPADWTVDRDALRKVRDVVFIQEQSVPIEEEWDELDPACSHVLARSADGTPIGTGRLTPRHSIGRMAVLPAWRGHGVGAAILQTLIDRARSMGWTQVHLNAQVHAIGFYQRHGFTPEGETFMEAGIEHRRMRRTLDVPASPPSERGKPPERPEREMLQARTRADLAVAVLRIIEQARHTLVIHFPDLAPGVLDRDDILEALRRLATSGRVACVRLLLHDPDHLLRAGHRLIPLAQRLTSSIGMRVLVEDEDRAYPSAFIASDSGGYLMRPLAERFEGYGSTCKPSESRQLTRYFEEVWQRSAPATVLRNLEL
ncbi:GNAT family N-acetyltransferase [Oleiagrimonas sp.]|jgi:predicted GNAT family N-acyltransferase|uniref:GNAT family N-acetyltransferase n=1 Tax=Oleiagrimonas sp. TaxID=2010330 RepID=UPI00263937EB|nr:GNAT family N-acetyltransferase [Oleiagrimonas sp.]MDA3914374.1 GNAT family N-acetyltransferase [Oleiagrimonas sp.]